MKYFYPIFVKHSLLTIIIVGSIVFCNVLFNNFVWLDYTYILNNPAAQGIHLQQIFTGSALTAQGYYRPLAALYLTITHSMFADQAFFYHFFQVALRILNTYLLFRLFTKFFKKPLAITLAMVYLVHPLNQSQVAFISSIADVLAITFGLSALLLASRIEQKTWHIIASCSLLFLALLSKESGILFYFATIVYQVIYQKKYLRKYILFSAATLVMYLGLRMFFQQLSQPDILLYPMARLTFIERLINVPQIYSFYISNFFLPNKIGGIHIWSHTNISLSTFYIPLAIDLVFISGLFIMGKYIAKHSKEMFLSFLFFLALYIPGQIFYLQLIPLDYTVSDRWFIFAMIGLLGLIGTFIATVKFSPKQLGILTLISVVILVGLSYKTFERNTYWKNDISLFQHWAKIDNNFVVQNWLANAYYTKKDYKNALVHARASVKMFPYDNNLMLKALAQEQLSHTKAAQKNMTKAISADNYAPGYHDPQTYSQFLQFLIRNNNHVDAVQVAQYAVKDYPADPYFWSMFAAENYVLGDKQEANTAIQKAMEIAPEKPQVQSIYSAITNNQQL